MCACVCVWAGGFILWFYVKDFNMSGVQADGGYLWRELLKASKKKKKKDDGVRSSFLKGRV